MLAIATSVNQPIPLHEDMPGAEDVRLEWLPSLPVTRKILAPRLPCIAFLYSESDSHVYHVFETDDLFESLTRYSRRQAAALGKDPDCRIAWLRLPAGATRTDAVEQLRSRFIDALEAQ